jgi:hypothetical protein
MTVYYVQPTAQGTEDGLSEANAKSPAQAMDIATTGNKFWWKDTGDYTVEDGANDCIIHLTNAGAEAAPNVHEGYSSTIGDGGIVTIDAADTHSYALLDAIGANSYTVFKGFEFKRGTSNGAHMGTSDAMTFKNCRFTANGANGIAGDNQLQLLNCSLDNNSDSGAEIDSDSYMFGVVAYTNTNYGIEVNNGALTFVLAYNNGNTDQIRFNSSLPNCSVLNCTIDGENQAAATGVNQVDAGGPVHVVNTIIYDCNTGILAGADPGERCIFAHNLFNSNTDDVSGVTGMEPDTDGLHAGGRGDQTAAAGFTDEANDDYSLTGSGVADTTGFCAKYTDDYWDSYIAANNPPTP